MPRKNFSFKIAVGPATLLVALFGLTAGLAQAGPVTGGPGNPPVVGSAVYQGVLAIIPAGAGDSIMEIGNTGSDIASTGDLYFRTSQVLGSAAASLVKNSGTGKTDLNLPGGLCLSGLCKKNWPVGGGGTSYWTTNSTWIEPVSNRGMYISRAATDASLSGALQVFGDNPVAAVSIDSSGVGDALTVGSALNVYGDIEVTGAITVLDCPPPGYNCPSPDPWEIGTVWHPGNDGRNSGLDASLLDGTDLHVLRELYDAGAGTNICGEPGDITAWCLCGEFESAGANECLKIE